MKFSLGLAGCFLLAAPVMAQTPKPALGTLTCTLAETSEQQTAPAAEERRMRCAFKPTESGAEQTYQGIIRKIGSGDKLRGKLVMIWVVHGPAQSKIAPGALEQSYTVSASGPDTKDRMLVGDRNSDIVMRSMTDNESAPATDVINSIELKMVAVPT